MVVSSDSENGTPLCASWPNTGRDIHVCIGSQKYRFVKTARGKKRILTRGSSVSRFAATWPSQGRRSSRKNGANVFNYGAMDWQNNGFLVAAEKKGSNLHCMRSTSCSDQHYKNTSAVPSVRPCDEKEPCFFYSCYFSRSTSPASDVSTVKME